MNRIDLRPAALAPGHAEGGHLQRRMLQELERQWLDSWGLAHASQPDAAWASSSTQDAATTDASASGGRDATAGFRSVPASGSAPTGDVRPNERNGGADRAPEPDTQRDLSTAAEAGAHQDGPAASGRQHESAMQPASPAAAARQATGPRMNDAAPDGPRTGTRRAAASMADAEASASRASLLQASAVAGLPGLLQGGAASEASSRTDGLQATTGASRETALATPYTLTALPIGMSASAVRPGALTEVSATGPDSKDRSSPPPRQRSSSEGDLGPQRLTLRELGQDQVLATLRDARLDHAASRLAAQGLARALMETGYAQVKVVVNGQRSHDERSPSDEAAAPDAPRTESHHPLPGTSVKESIRGH